MEDFLIRNSSRICIYSQETKSYISVKNNNLIKADSSHPFLLSDFSAKKQIEFYIQIVSKGKFIEKMQITSKTMKFPTDPTNMICLFLPQILLSSVILSFSKLIQY